MKYNFAKLLQSGGQVTKYQIPAGGVSYNFDSFLDNLPTNLFQRGQTKSSIAWTPNWSDLAGKYENVAALEANDKYKAFTDYVINNAGTDSRVMDYLKLLEQSTTGDGHKAILFNGENLINNWQDEYRRLRNDGKYGFYHLGPEGDPERPPLIPPPPVPPPGTPPETPPETPPLEFPPVPGKPEKSPWTDWIPLSAQLANDLISSGRLAALLKKMKFPLIEGPYLLHTITNNYALRAALNQNAADLRSRAAMQNGSDMITNMANMQAADVNAAQIENQAELLKTEQEAKDRQIAEQYSNQNKQTAADVANYNRKQNIAAWNNILDANARQDLRNTQAMNSYIGNMYTSHGEWLKDQRLNDQQYIRGLNQHQANLALQQAYKNYYDLASDYTKSKAYQDFATAVGNSSGNDIADFDSDRYNDTSRRDAYIKELWAGDSDLAKQYQGLYNTEMTNAEQAYYDKYQQIANELEAANLLLPARISNQGFYRRPNYGPTYSPIFTHAKGGSVRARFIDYQNHIQKEQLELKKAQHKRNELSTKKLTADLDRLSKEQMILLRSVFK